MVKLFNDTYRIKSARLEGWDYNWPGHYFVTINCHNNIHHFGKVCNGTMKLTDMGTIAENIWKMIPDKFRNAAIDEFVIMPDHLHGIVIIKPGIDVYPCFGIDVPPRRVAGDCSRRDVGGFPRRDAINRVSTERQRGGKTGTKNPMLHGTNLSKIIRWYKGRVTFEINRNYPEREFKWQPRFYDRIIRDSWELVDVRRYIEGNVVKE